MVWSFRTLSSKWPSRNLPTSLDDSLKKIFDTRQ